MTEQHRDLASKRSNLLLAWAPARGPVVGWPTSVARAAVVVALVGAAGAALMLLGGLLSDSTGGLIPM